MSDVRGIAIALSALEVLPAEPSDLTALLMQAEQKAALFALTPADRSNDLTTWLCSEIDHARVEHWEKRIDALLRDSAVTPLLADDDRYPNRLGECWDRPPLLFVHGTLLDRSPTVAIVGNRDAEDASLRAANNLGSALAADGVTIVSGMATGIDTAGHEGALAADGHTVAVMGTGILNTYPAANGELASRISASGALVSQFRPDAPPTSTSFLRRNSVIAGIADISIVMGGRPRSGSRHQSEQAVRYGRPLLLWAPTLHAEQWANEAVTRQEAEFVASIDDVRAVVRSGH